ncbi:hypothetical protein [Streptomyces sp. NPDC018972]|uniref:hypothetical protein n=1 Tax=Streptomyces sp. NPDC018972 TaxID=3365060 RepID=UPI00379433D7
MATEIFGFRAAPDIESDVPDCRSIGFGLRFFLNRRVKSGSLSRSVGRPVVAVPAGALRAHLMTRQLPCIWGALTLPEGCAASGAAR